VSPSEKEPDSVAHRDLIKRDLEELAELESIGNERPVVAILSFPPARASSQLDRVDRGNSI
jgi:hypothetical protein